MSDDNELQGRDDLRMEIAIQTVKDVLIRFDESSEGTRSVYELLGFVLTDLITSGMCPACLNDAITMAFTEAAADPETHIEDNESTLH